MSGGLHCPGGLDSSCADRFYGSLRPGAKHYIYATMHAPGKNKDKTYERQYGLEATRAYNPLVRERAARVGAVVLDAYAVTYNETSIDGQHYLEATNVDLAQLLLNLVATLHREDLQAEAAAATPSPSPPAAR